jgi:uncharacterized protein (TIGR03083 family)
VALPSPTYLAHLEQAAADVAAMLETGDLDAPVPACPPWRVTDLVHHLGGVHRWARVAVVESSAQRPDTGDAPTERDALVAWFSEGVDALVATLRETDPGTPCWTFGPPPTAAFWFRRQAHETAAHAGDLAAALGRTRSYGTALALDGIDETAGVFFPRQVRLGRIAPLVRTLAVEADEGGRWVFAGDGTDPDPQHVDGTLSGPAEAMLPLLWHRITLDDARLSVSGDRDAVEAVLATALAS